MRLSPAGLNLLKSFEGCRLTAYRDSVGVWTVGYGSTKGVQAGHCISQDEAERRLREDDLPQFEKAVNDVCGPLGDCPRPNQNQFDAMVCLAYNIGAAAFSGSSVARRFRQGNIEGAADAFLMWNKGRVNGKLTVLQGLANRRAAERALFLKTPAVQST